jgi:hypothetical protein
MPIDTDQTLNELNILFQEMILEMLGYTKTGSPAAFTNDDYYHVRVDWPTGGAPSWKVTEDIVFIQVIEDDDPVNREREVKETEVDDVTLNEETSYTRVVALHMIFYGPNSFANAQIVRDGVFKDSYRLPLNREKIYPIPDIVSPTRAPEIFASQWWERVDLELRFNEGIKKNDEIGVIESAEIIVEDHSGIVSDTTITTE